MYNVPIRLLRYPDRELPTKPVYAERINPFPTTMYFSAGKAITHGRSMIAPTSYRFWCRQSRYRRNGQARSLHGATEFCTNIAQSCVTRNDTVSSIDSTPGHQRYMYPQLPQSASEKVERINPFPTRVRCKAQQRTCVVRGTHGFVGSFDTGLPEIYVSVAASMRLRKIFDEFAGLIDDARV